MTALCVHRWRLDEPNGTAFVPGTCRYCGMTRNDFRVSEEWMSREDFMRGTAAPRPSFDVLPRFYI